MIFKHYNIWLVIIFLIANQTKSYTQNIETDSTDIFDYRLQVGIDNGLASNIAVLFSYSTNSIKKFKRKLNQTKDSSLDYSIFYAASPHKLEVFEKRLQEAKDSSLIGEIIYFYALGENNYLEFGTKFDKCRRTKRVKDDVVVFCSISSYTIDKYFDRLKILNLKSANRKRVNYVYAASQHKIN